MLRYTPEQFRCMTIEEFKLAIDGYSESQGNDKKKKLMSRNELLDLMGK